MTNMLESESLLCNEVLDMSELKTPEKPQQIQHLPPAQQQQHYPETIYPPTVQAIEDLGQLKDNRILQNLLRNEHKFLPQFPNYLVNIQEEGITPAMRKTVADWMLEVVQEQFSQPEVFCLAMNIMDRFLCHVRIHKSQLQLVGSVCILIASKIREPCPIPGKTLITYTDDSITADELKDWEILILYKLQWELTAITALDYLDYVLPRMELEEVARKWGFEPMDPIELRRRTETILVLAATEYQFSYHAASLLATSAILAALQSMGMDACKPVFRQVQLCLQTATHAATIHLEQCINDLNIILPGFLKALPVNPNCEEDLPVPDSTCSPIKSVSCPSTPPRTCPSPPPSLSRRHHRSASLSPPRLTSRRSRSPKPDLHCQEKLSNDVELIDDFDHQEVGCMSPITLSTTTSSSSSTSTATGFVNNSSRSSSPYSAVDLFSDYEIQSMFEPADGLDSPFSILVS